MTDTQRARVHFVPRTGGAVFGFSIFKQFQKLPSASPLKGTYFVLCSFQAMRSLVGAAV
jgi:hypothetical protein